MKFALGVLFAFTFVAGFAQTITYSYHFTQLLSEKDLGYISPLEGAFRPQIEVGDDYAEYDLVIKSEREDIELRYIVDDEPPKLAPAHRLFLMSHHLAENHDSLEIRMWTMDDDSAAQAVQADWVAYADFIPKLSLTNTFHFGRLVSAYLEGRGMIHTIILYNDPNKALDQHMHRLYYQQAASAD